MVSEVIILTVHATSEGAQVLMRVLVSVARVKFMMMTGADCHDAVAFSFSGPGPQGAAAGH